MITSPPNTSRTLIIGLDGASPHLVRKWQSDLPNLSSLIENGTFGTLTSVMPPRSIPAWYCFATGMNPAKIGVFGFSQRIPGTYDYRFANMTYCRAPTFWRWLNDHGIKTTVLHVPGTYPPQDVDDVLVSGWPGPLNAGNLIYTSPPSLSREIDRLLGRPFEFLSPKPMRADNDSEMLGERIRFIHEHGRVAWEMLKNSEWQLGVAVLSPVDRASHQFWRHMDPEHPAHGPEAASELKNALKTVYAAADEEVGRLLSLLKPEDTVFVVSDHGFGPARRIFYLNEWLVQKGYLVLEEETPPAGRNWIGRLAAPLFQLNRISPLFRKISAPFKRRGLSNRLRNAYVHARQAGRVRINHLRVNWKKTRAYCPDEAALYINLAGRDPQGVVPRGAEEALIDAITRDLQDLRDPDTGRQVPVKVYRKHEIFSGPFLDDAPDLIITMDDFQTEVMAEMNDGALFGVSIARNGTHTMEGLLIAHGPGILNNPAGQARLIDIAPTVVHLLGCPVPEETDGRVLLDLFEDQAAIRSRPIEHEQALEGMLSDIEDFSQEDAASVEERLRDLGYLG